MAVATTEIDFSAPAGAGAGPLPYSSSLGSRDGLYGRSAAAESTHR